MNYSSKCFQLFISILVFSLLFIGCDISNSNSSGDRLVSVKMMIESSSTQKQLSSNTASSADTLTEVKMLVEELELESSVDEDSLDFEVDNLIVNLPLDGSVIDLSSSIVPEGTYDSFEMEIEHSDDSNVNDPDFYNDSGDDDDGYTIVIKGIYNGDDFTYKSSEDFELELELNPPLEVSNNSSPSVAVNVDPSSWFKDSSGNDLDPNNPDNREKIDENIENSFEAELDDDDDDDDDDDSDDDDDK